MRVDAREGELTVPSGRSPSPQPSSHGPASVAATEALSEERLEACAQRARSPSRTARARRVANVRVDGSRTDEREVVVDPGVDRGGRRSPLARRAVRRPQLGEERASRRLGRAATGPAERASERLRARRRRGCARPAGVLPPEPGHAAVLHRHARLGERRVARRGPAASRLRAHRRHRIEAWARSRECSSSPRRTSSSATTPGSRAASGPSRRRRQRHESSRLHPPVAVVHIGIAGGRGITLAAS